MRYTITARTKKVVSALTVATLVTSYQPTASATPAHNETNDGQVRAQLVAAPQFPAAGPVATIIAVAALLGVVAVIASSAGSSSSPSAPSGSNDRSDAPTTPPAGGDLAPDKTGARSLPGDQSDGMIGQQDDEGLTDAKLPRHDWVINPGYDLSQPLEGYPGPTVEQARAFLLERVNAARINAGAAPLVSDQVTDALAENEAIVLGRQVIRYGDVGYRQPNAKNWLSNPSVRTSSWFKGPRQTVAAIIGRSPQGTADGPSEFIDQLDGTRSSRTQLVDPAFTRGGVGVWRDPDSGAWYFTIALFN